MTYYILCVLVLVAEPNDEVLEQFMQQREKAKDGPFYEAKRKAKDGPFYEAKRKPKTILWSKTEKQRMDHIMKQKFAS